MISAFKSILDDTFHVSGRLLVYLRVSVIDALVLVKRSIFRLAMGNLGRSRKGWGSLWIPLTLHESKGLDYDIEKTTSLSFTLITLFSMR